MRKRCPKGYTMIKGVCTNPNGSVDIDTPFFQYGPGHPSMGSCLRDCLMRNSSSHDCFHICGRIRTPIGSRYRSSPPKMDFRRGGRPRRRKKR